MPKVKVQRKSTWVDMTAMCDVAFLLLNFFMLTSNFTVKEAIQVVTPSSVSEIKIPETNIMSILIDKDGKVFFGIDKAENRIALLNEIATENKIIFTEKEKYAFSLIGSFGVPIEKLKAFLDLPSEVRDMKDNAIGIPCDSLDNQFRSWVKYGRKVNPDIRIAIKADQSTPFPKIKTVLNTLQELRENRYNLITKLEEMPAGL